LTCRRRLVTTCLESSSLSIAQLHLSQGLTNRGTMPRPAAGRGGSDQPGKTHALPISVKALEQDSFLRSFGHLVSGARRHRKISYPLSWQLPTRPPNCRRQK
jgi:hypothetical protein